MQFKNATAALCALLLAVAQAAPAAAPDALAMDTSGIESPNENSLTKRRDECSNSSFSPYYSGGKASVADCQKLSNNIAGDGSWMVHGFKGTTTVASYGRCRFLATTNLAAPIGNQDVRDLIRDSIAKFSYKGEIRATGAMECGGQTSPFSGRPVITWFIEA